MKSEYIYTLLFIFISAGSLNFLITSSATAASCKYGAYTVGRSKGVCRSYANWKKLPLRLKKSTPAYSGGTGSGSSSNNNISSNTCKYGAYTVGRSKGVCRSYANWKKLPLRLKKITPAYLGGTGSESQDSIAKGNTNTLSVVGGVSFVAPVCGCSSCRMGSGYGPRKPPKKGASSFHKARDISAPMGTPVTAIAAGTVSVRNDSRTRGYGRQLRVVHNKTYESRYAHLSSFVRTSGKVSAGDLIGFVGSTGVSTGPHLHIEVLKNGTKQNPNGYIGTSNSNVRKQCSGKAKPNGRDGNGTSAGGIK